MSRIILDCSVAVSWIIDDEDSSQSRALLDIVAEHGALVPSHWILETGNAILYGTRRKRLSKEQRQQGLHLLSALPIIQDAETPAHAWDMTLSLADKHNLTLYDAPYLELAIRTGLPLATFDKQLYKAATNEQCLMLYNA